MKARIEVAEAKAVRDKLCITVKCALDKGCGCLEAIDAALERQAAEIKRLRKGIQDFLNGDYEPKVRKYDKCPHGQYGYEICEGCIDAWFSKLLTTTPPPGSAAG